MMAFGAKIKLYVNTSGASAFRTEIQKYVNTATADKPIKLKNFSVSITKDQQKRIIRDIQTYLSSDNALTLKIGKIDATGAISKLRQQLQTMLSGLSITGLKEFIDETDIEKKTKTIKDANEAAAKWAAQMRVVKDISKRLGTTYQSALSGNRMIEDTTQITEITAAYTAWQAKVEALRNTEITLSDEEMQNLQQEGIELQRKIALIQKAQIAAGQAADAESQAAAQRETDANKELRLAQQQVSLKSQVQRYILSNSKAYKAFGTELDAIMHMLNNEGMLTDEQLKQIRKRFTEIQISARSAGKTGSTFFDTLKKGWEKFGGWSLVTKSMMAAWRVVTKMISAVKELDAAMTELKKVSDLSEKSYRSFLKTAQSMSQTVGATLADTVNATADFARLGYSLSDSTALAEAALVYKNVGDGIEDIGTASESLISTIKAFEQFGESASNAMSIIDRFNEVGNNFSISSAGIGEALQRSASALASAGNTLNESIALITGMNAVVQDPDSVGTALKTISMYLRAAKTEAEEAGESTDGMANSVSELREELLTLTKGKVDIMLDDKTFKSTYEIMKDLSKIWEDLADIDKANIIELIGGKRNANAITSLLSNFQDAEYALQTAATATGSAYAENEKYLESIEGKLSRLRSSFEGMSESIINSEFIKSLIDGVTTLVKLIEQAADSFGSLPVILGAGSVAFSVFGKNIEFIDASLLAVRSNIGKYNDLLNSSDLAQSNFMLQLEKSDDILAGYLKSLNGGKASLKGYKVYCQQAGVQTQTLGIKAKASAIGVTLLNVALQMLISFGVGLLVEGLISAFTHLTNATQEAVEKTNELNEAYRDFKQENRDNIKTLNSLRSEFEELSDGVDRYGRNVTLTSEQYERYKDIIETIVSISPLLSEGYDEEIGYLVDKNELLERAIELQETEYKQELRQMASLDSLSTAMGGYIATASDLTTGGKMSKSESSLTNSYWNLYRVSDRDIDGNSAQYLARTIMEALSVEEIDNEMQKYFNKYGYFQSSWFWDDYAEQAANNVDKIAASIDYSSIGYESKKEFEKAIDTTKNAALEYNEVRDELDQANKNVANQLQLVAENNDAYSDLSNEAKGLVSNFVNSFDVDDVQKDAPWWMFWKSKVVDEDALQNIRVQINDFIRSLTPEVQNAISGMFSLKEAFEIDDVSTNEYKATIDSIISDLKNAGLDDDSIHHIELSLEIDKFKEKVNHAKEILKDEFNDKVGDLTASELDYIYSLDAEAGSMTFEELKEYLDQMKLANADLTDTLDFTNFVKGLDETKDGLNNIISAMQQLKQGTALTQAQLGELALEYPKLLEQANLFTDGSIEGQEKMLNSILDVSEKAYDAQIDAKIAELKSTELVISDQLSLEKQKSDIIGEIKNLTVNGEVEQEEDLVNKITELNNLQGKNYIKMQDGTLQVNEEALNSKLGQEAECGEIAAENIWEPYATTIRTSHTKGYSKSLEAMDTYGGDLFTKVKNIASRVWGALANAVKDAVSGNWQGISHYFSEALGSSSSNNIDVGEVTVTFDGKKVYVGNKSLDNWTDEQYQASVSRIDALKEMQDRTVHAIENLEALKGLDLTTLYGSSSSSNKSDKEIEEYVADIDKYAEATQKLQDAQRKRAQLERDLASEETAFGKVGIQKELNQAYKEEQDALHELNDLRDQTIKDTIPTLEALGFQIEYNADTNRFYIANLEHLNELQAESAGEYETVEEATNAFRKETEELIDSITDLNEENENSSQNWLDLAENIGEGKDKIVEYLNDVVTEAVDFVDSVKSVYDTLKSAAEEYNDTGAISVDSLKAIAEYGAEYMNYLKDENGMLSINKENIEAVIVARTKQLAVDTAFSYVEKLRVAISENNVKELDRLISATEQASDATWELVYSNLALLDLDDSQYTQALANINRLRSLANNAVESIKLGTDESNNGYEDMQDALEKILDLTMELIEYEVNQEIEALEEQKEKYREIIDLKKEALETTKEENDYNKEVAKKVAEIAKIQAKIDKLSLDDSREAQAEKAALEQELSELQTDLSDYQTDYSVDKQKEMLDEIADSYEEEKDEEIAVLEKSISSTEKIYQLAIDRINTDWDNLYDDIIGWNYEAGSSIESEIVAAWKLASKAVQEYGSYVEATNKLVEKTASEENLDLGASGNYGDPKAIVSQMRNNSLKWFTVSDAEQSQLSSANKTLASQLSSIYEQDVTSKNGTWYLDGEADPLYSIGKWEAVDYITKAMKNNSAKWNSATESERAELEKANEKMAKYIADLSGQKVWKDSDGIWWIDNAKLYESYGTYHTGGVVGDSTLKKDEVMAILKDGELVLDEKREEGLYKLVDFAQILSERLGTAIDTSKFDNLFGGFSLLPTSRDLLPVAHADSLLTEFSPHIEVNISHNGSMSDNDARRYGGLIAETALGELKDAFAKKGITNIGNSVLK